MRLALLPLPVFLLPGGKMRLKIIEPRYLRLVGEAMQDNLGFALCLQTKNNNYFKIATRVCICDFDKTDDDILLIDIEAQEQVLLNQIDADNDGLLHAQVMPFSNSGKQQLQEINPELFGFASRMLKAHLIHHPLYQNNIEQLPFNNMSWVCWRWLELLPLDIREKYWLANSFSTADNLNYVCQYIAKNQVDNMQTQKLNTH